MVDVEAAALAVQVVIWDDEREADTLSPPNFGIIHALSGIEPRGDGGRNGSREGRWVETDGVTLRTDRKA